MTEVEMVNQETNILLAYFIMVVLLACTLYFLNENNLLRLQLADREAELSAVHAELGAKDVFVTEARVELVEFRNEIDRLGKGLNESGDWIQNNSVLSGSLESVATDVEQNCIINGTLDLACISKEMEKTMGFRYITEWEDRLFSLEEMAAREGGDCDDYALFAKALLNTMKDRNVSVGLAARNVTGSSIFSLVDLNGTFNSSESVSVGDLDSVYPVAICYTISSRGEAIGGHCVNAMSAAPIESVEDLEKLEGAPTFDPQNGKFTGIVGEDFHLCVDGETDCDHKRTSIGTIVTDTDLYEFKDDSWKSPGRYKDVMDGMLERIDATLSRTDAWDNSG